MYRKHFLPLESNPEVFTDLIHDLGVSTSLAFVDVFSVDDQDLLALVPRPVLALILVFPTSAAYEAAKADEERMITEYDGCGTDEDVVWFKQTINNACGLYGVLHAVSNGKARDYIDATSTLSTILKTCILLQPEERALALEASSELEKAHTAAATQGYSAVPTNAEDEVDFHYVCFVRSQKNGHLYEMDGDRKGPVDLGPVVPEHGDLLSEGALDVVRSFIRREEGTNLHFSLIALVPNPDV